MQHYQVWEIDFIVEVSSSYAIDFIVEVVLMHKNATHCGVIVYNSFGFLYDISSFVSFQLRALGMADNSDKSLLSFLVIAVTFELTLKSEDRYLRLYVFPEVMSFLTNHY